jgi:hypothetical protein
MVNHSNPTWRDSEVTLLLENYLTKEMRELEEVLAQYDFPRPPEGIKRKLENLLAEGMALDKERIKYLSKRKYWRQEAYLKHKNQSHVWRRNNPDYFKSWCEEHPDYMKSWLTAHPGYFREAAKRFLEKNPDYFKNYRTNA